MTFPRPVRRLSSFGGRVPPIIGALIIVTALLSLLIAPGLALGTPLALWAMLIPGEVARGQLWRLATWVFFAREPIGLLFAGLSLYWFARDLLSAWGTRWFLGLYFGIAAAVGLLVTGATLLLHGRGAGLVVFSGAEAMSTALIVLWALSYPDRTINFFLVLPLQGRNLVLVVLGATALFAAYSGLTAMLPEIGAELVSLGFMYRGYVLRPLRRLFRPLRPAGRKRPPTQFQVWDDKKQQFRPPKWMN